MQKIFAFYQDKDIDMLKLGCTLTDMADVCLRKYTDTIFYPFYGSRNDILKYVGEDFVVGPSIVLSTRQLSVKLFFENLQTCANQLLGLMLANCTHMRCYNLCRPNFTFIGVSIQSQVHSHLNKTKPAVLRISLCPIFNEQENNVKLKTYIQDADRKLTASVLMGFCSHCNIVFEAMVCFYHFCPDKIFVHSSLKRIFSMVVRRESLINSDKTIYTNKN